MSSSATGRFDQSFVIRMIRDFLLALTAIVVLELGGRLLLEWYEFSHQDVVATDLAAERLAGDVKSIMLNQGGPVAARTVYPILKRNQQDLGLEIAIIPSEITREAIQRNFGYDPRGIPPDWSDGVHHEATVELEAEEFCTTCHSTASVGDVLGRVVVRNYRSSRMAKWWQEARVISVVGMANVILHTIILFVLLRMRMEPLLRLRAMVARLAKGNFDLSQRAVPRSNDEFGELAIDLNHFLDRVCHLVEDLDAILGKVGAANERLTQVSSQMGSQIETVRTKARQALEEVVSIHSGVVSAQMRPSAEGSAEVVRRLQELTAQLTDLLHEVDDDSHYLSEIRLLEERMKTVAESGQVLLGRLRSN